MPSLQHLLDELRLLGVDPDGIDIPGQAYLGILADVVKTNECPEPDELPEKE